MSLMLRIIVMYLVVMQMAFAARSEIVVSRYKTVKAEPTTSQKDILSVVVQLKFPRTVITVGEAINYVLLRSGYVFDQDDQRKATQYLISHKLPKVHREIGPITLRSALKVLAGPAFELKLNPIQRRITFNVRDQYQQYLSNEDESAVVLGNHSVDDIDLVIEDGSTSPIIIKPSPYSVSLVSGRQGVEQEKQGTTDEYGPVESNETLWIISEKVIEKYSLDMDVVSVMKVLFENNQHAFISENMNGLKQGVILRIPPSDVIAGVRSKDAWRLSTLHYDKWLNKGSNDEGQ